MLRRDRQRWTTVYQLKDAALFMVALWLAHLLRTNLPLDFLERRGIGSFGPYAWLSMIIIPGAPLILELQGFYKRALSCPPRTTAWLLAKSCFFVTLGVIVVMFLLNIKELSRLVIILFGGISFLLVYVTEVLLQLGYRSRFGQLQIRRRVMLVGAKSDTERMHADLSERADESLEIVAELDLNDTSLEQLVKLMHERSPSGVIINAKHTFFGQIEKAIQACELEGVEAWLVADFFRTQIARTSIDDFYGRPVLVFRSTPDTSWQGLVKLVLDVVLAFIALVLFSWLFLLIALLIKFTSPGPILFRQERCGLSGHPFTMLKFRSMVTDAEQRKHELAVLNEMGGPVFKLSNDPRVTPVGRILRRFSLDELPQLLNVLRGEMSLVGPRPLPVDEVERFDDPAHRRRLSVRPGLTCLWQISGRNDVRDFKDWVRLDLQYIDNWSLWLDLKILCRTVPIVLVGTGAR